MTFTIEQIDGYNRVCWDGKELSCNYTFPTDVKLKLLTDNAPHSQYCQVSEGYEFTRKDGSKAIYSVGVRQSLANYATATVAVTNSDSSDKEVVEVGSVDSDPAKAKFCAVYADDGSSNVRVAHGALGHLSSFHLGRCFQSPTAGNQLQWQ